MLNRFRIYSQNLTTPEEAYRYCKCSYFCVCYTFRQLGYLKLNLLAFKMVNNYVVSIYFIIIQINSSTYVTLVTKLWNAAKIKQYQELLT